MKLRRFPHLHRGAASDPLDLVLSLPPSEAREAERMLRSDYRSRRSFELRQTVEADLPAGGFERYVDLRTGQLSSTGGGRRRPTYQPCE